MSAIPDSIILVVLGLLFLALCALPNQRRRT